MTVVQVPLLQSYPHRQDGISRHRLSLGPRRPPMGHAPFVENMLAGAWYLTSARFHCRSRYTSSETAEQHGGDVTEQHG